MADRDNKEELIDVSEFESELSDDALTEIDHDEVTPIRKKTPRSTLMPPAPPTLIQRETQKAGTYIATLRERFAAFFIDSMVIFYLYWATAILYCRFFLGSWSAPIPYTNWHGLAFHGSFLLICFLYYFVLEGIFLATIGKFICWMSVRKKDGEHASLTSTFIRNLIRPIDYILIIPIIFMMELTRCRQRLGDVIAGSTVVKKFGTTREPYNLEPKNLASATGRTFALAIDLTFFIAFAAGYVLILSPKMVFISQWLLLLTPLVMLTYFVTIEMFSETSPGKWLMGYITCNDNGRRLTISSSIIRNIWRILDTNPAGLLCIFLSSNRQRPGDLAAGTVVLKHKRKAKGLISFALAILFVASTIYLGITNQTNILSPKFKFNFLPNLSIITKLGLSLPKYADLEIQNFRFAANEPNQVRVPATFKAGETVYLVFELNGYKKLERKIWLQEDLSVTYPDGTIGLDQKNIVDYQQVVKGDGPIELTNNIELPSNAVSGTYIINITIRDKYAGTEVREKKEFFVRRTFTMEQNVEPTEVPPKIIPEKVDEKAVQIDTPEKPAEEVKPKPEEVTPNKERAVEKSFYQPIPQPAPEVPQEIPQELPAEGTEVPLKETPKEAPTPQVMPGETKSETDIEELDMNY